MVRTPIPHPDAELQVRLGAAVKARRLGLDLTQEELAWRAGMHRTYLADIERGVRNVTLRTLRSLATALNVPVSVLLAEPPSPSEPAPAAASETEAPVDRMGEIILIDPNREDVDLTLRVFREARFSNPVRVFRDGERALDHLLGEREGPPPQLVLLDLKLPKVSGLEVLRRLRTHPRTRSIPVVVLLVSHQETDVREFHRLGAEHFVLKPVAFESLHRTAPKLGFEWALLTPTAEAGSS